MALTLSTGCVKKLMDTGSFVSVFNLCKINIYSGSKPTSPNDVPNGTLLVTVTNAGTATGLTWEAAAPAGVASKKTTETWSGTIATTGTAGWFRIYETGDTPANSSTTYARVDGTISTSGADMNLGSLSLTATAPFVLTQCDITLPTS